MGAGYKSGSRVQMGLGWPRVEMGLGLCRVQMGVGVGVGCRCRVKIFCDLIKTGLQGTEGSRV